MSAFILVHGSWHGRWCWIHLLPLLIQAGHQVLAPDLAGLGEDLTPPGQVILDTWVKQIGGLLLAEPGPVILVGHDQGGIVISQVAEDHPDRITGLIYIAGFLLRDGETLIQLAQTDTESLVLPNLSIDEAAGYTMISRAQAPVIFYNTSPRADIDRAVPLLRPEPASPTFTPVHLTAANFGALPRAYITTRRDQTIGPLLQDRMLAATPCDPVVSFATDHSPFFSAPTELAAALTAIAATFPPEPPTGRIDSTAAI